MKRLALVLACTTLAACSGDRAEPPTNNEAAAEAPASAPDNAASPPVEANATAPPAASAIPAAFRGTWAVSEAACAERLHESRLVISETTLRLYESVTQVARVEEIGPREINIIGTATGEGTTRPAEYHFSIDAAGETLTDEAGGGMVRRRCGG